MGDASHLILDKPGSPRYTLDALVRERSESLTSEETAATPVVETPATPNPNT
jgi:hypothetical protein